MNFVCDKCKQKYHVADEKIRGRAVTRFRCKKCENVIELRGDALPDPDAPDAPKQADAPDSRPRPATMAPSSPRPAVTPIGPSAPPG
ncbi:MAG: zinc-ribbon domain-containing protein, partial [Deltaproteobacteria bacterium]|nr:zinc-ribbon domain-containing protein [Deltaproteobacteria bacterium]